MEGDDDLDIMIMAGRQPTMLWCYGTEGLRDCGTAGKEGRPVLSTCSAVLFCTLLHSFGVHVRRRGVGGGLGAKKEMGARQI